MRTSSLKVIDLRVICVYRMHKAGGPAYIGYLLLTLGSMATSCCRRLVDVMHAGTNAVRWINLIMDMSMQISDILPMP